MGYRVCGWCGRYMGNAPKVEGETTGICPSCSKKQEEAIGKMVQEDKKKKDGKK